MQIFGDRKDSLLWKSSHDGDFSMTSAYASNFTADNNPQIFMGNWVWKVDIWPKISSFLWLCHHNSVPVRQVVAARGINCDTTCPLCNNQEETILHLSRDCPFAVSFWQAIKTPLSLLNLCHLNLAEWLKRISLTATSWWLMVCRGAHNFFLPFGAFGNTGTGWFLKTPRWISASTNHVFSNPWSITSVWAKCAFLSLALPTWYVGINQRRDGLS